MSSNDINPGKHHTLIFDVVKTNAGNGYNKISGWFTAPVSGLYALACSISMKGYREFASYDIIKNAEIVGAFFVDIDNLPVYRSHSMTVIVSLQVGDVLFVRTSSIHMPQGNIVSDDVNRSSVAGWLIQ